METTSNQQHHHHHHHHHKMDSSEAFKRASLRHIYRKKQMARTAKAILVAVAVCMFIAVVAILLFDRGGVK